MKGELCNIMFVLSWSSARLRRNAQQLQLGWRRQTWLCMLGDLIQPLLPDGFRAHDERRTAVAGNLL
jgi:hypothetical protein